MSQTTSPQISNTASEKTGYRQLLAQPGYSFLILAQLVSDLGDGVYAIGLVWAMKQLTGSAVQLSMVLTAELIPVILIGLFAGVYVDRTFPKRVLLVSDLFRGFVIAIIAALGSYHALYPWMIVLAAAVLSTFSAFFTPARTLLIRQLVEERLILFAQGLAQNVQTVVGLTAPAIAAFLIQAGVANTFWFDSATFFASFGLLAFIRADRGPKPNSAGSLTMRAIGASLSEGFQAIRSVPILSQMMLYAVLLNFLFAPVSILLPLYADTPNQFAVYETAFFVGMFTGTAAIGLFKNKRKIIPILLGLLLMMCGFFALAIAGAFSIAVCFVALIGFGITLTNVPLNTLMIVKVPREVLGRASSALRMISQIAKPASLSLTGTFLLLISVRSFFQAIAIAGIGIILLMLANPTFRNSTD